MAEDLAVRYPLLAAGGLPPEVMAELDPATDPAIVEALVSGTSPILRALDQIEHTSSQSGLM